jgi:hypothetical protein
MAKRQPLLWNQTPPKTSSGVKTIVVMREDQSKDNADLSSGLHSPSDIIRHVSGLLSPNDTGKSENKKFNLRLKPFVVNQ